MPADPEIRDQLDEMIERLHILGARPETVDAVREGWNAGDDNTRFDYRERLRRMNDTALAAEIRLAEADLEPEVVPVDVTGEQVRGDLVELDD